MVWMLLIPTQPYTLACLLGVVLLTVAWFRRREARRGLVGVGVVLIAVGLMSTRIVADLLTWPLESRYHRLERRPDTTQAIVVLSGNVLYPDDRHTELGEDTLYRCLHAAELYRAGPPCPLLTTGGKVDSTVPGPSFARVMADFLETQGVQHADLILEDRSRTTYENAVESARLLRERGLRRVVLVTAGSHLLRAEKCFRRQGIEVVPSACHYRDVREGLRVSHFFPDPKNLARSQEAFHEYIGLAWYWLTDKL